MAGKEIREFTTEELAEATGNWHELCVIGEGGFGRVYRGMVQRTPVAIKVLDSNGLQGMQEFRNEADLLSRISHPHIVKLLGTCTSGSSACLVYDLAPAGNLETRLQGKGGAERLAGPVRIRILSQLADAVSYLHGRSPPIVHRDLKPSNVFLDADLNVQLGDVGLAAAASSSTGVVADSSSSSSDIIGDWAYLAPEYKGSSGKKGREAGQPRGQHSTRTDIYALGLTILQVATGAPTPQGLLEQVHSALEEGDAMQALDPLAAPWDAVEGERALKLGVWCCMDSPDQRPTAAVVRDELLRLLGQSLEPTRLSGLS